MSSKKLVFVYIGEKLPSYARKSIKLAQQYSGLEVVLVCEKRFLFTGLDDENIFILSHISKNRFPQIPNNSAYTKFRDGFWIKTIQRFFALEEYMQTKKVDQCFHAELDNLVFANDGLAYKLNSFGSGLFVPFDAPNRAIASFVYLNSISILEKFCQFIEHVDGNHNDMELLAMFGAMNPSDVFALPSSINNNNLKSGLLLKGIQTVDERQSGIFDAAALGQWYFGIDPRNSYFKICNRFRNEIADLDMNTFCMRWNNKTFQFSATLFGNDEKEVLVNNLHVHSKIFRKLSHPGKMVSIVNRTDSGEIILITRNMMGIYRAMKHVLLAVGKITKIAKVS
jgi:hypothetical protein